MRNRHIMPFGMIVCGLLANLPSACRSKTGQDQRAMTAGFAASATEAAGTQADATAISRVLRPSCHNTIPYKIVGGQIATEKSQVSASTVKLIIRNQKYCTGTLIGPQHIVTAAHCVADVKDPKELRIGSGLDGKIQEKLEVTGLKVHPLFIGILADERGYLNQPFYDVAVLTFQGALTSSMIAVNLAQPEEVQAGMPIIVSGYGAYGSDDKARRPLSLVEARLGKVETEFLELQIASGEGRGACFGDSGGPSFIVDPASSCLLLIGSTTGPGRNTDYSCEAGGGTLMDLTRYQSWLACAFKELNQAHDGLNSGVCDSK